MVEGTGRTGDANRRRATTARAAAGAGSDDRPVRGSARQGWLFLPRKPRARDAADIAYPAHQAGLEPPRGAYPARHPVIARGPAPAIGVILDSRAPRCHGRAF